MINIPFKNVNYVHARVYEGEVCDKPTIRDCFVVILLAMTLLVSLCLLAIPLCHCEACDKPL